MTIDIDKTSQIVHLKREVDRLTPKWHPIEDAPKMKSILLFAVTDIGEDGTIRNWKMATGFWHTGYSEDDNRTPWEWEGRQLMRYDIQPTHWQYLPEPPQCLFSTAAL